MLSCLFRPVKFQPNFAETFTRPHMLFSTTFCKIGYCYQTCFRGFSTSDCRNPFLSFFDADALGIDKRDILMASTVASAGEFEMVCSIAERPDELNFDYAMSYPFKARMYLLQVEREEADALYREALQVGIKQYKELQ